jgi:hypothetical protein
VPEISGNPERPEKSREIPAGAGDPGRRPAKAPDGPAQQLETCCTGARVRRRAGPRL